MDAIYEFPRILTPFPCTRTPLLFLLTLPAIPAGALLAIFGDRVSNSPLF